LSVVWWLVTAAQNARGAMEYRTSLYLLSFVALIITFNAAIYVALRRRISVQNLFIGAAFWWVMLAVLSSIFMALRFDALTAISIALTIVMALLILPLRAFVKSGELLFPQGAAACAVVL